MRIDRLELENFRNYGRQAADFDSRCNVIFGENAQGKTNLLESLVYLSCGRSPRARSVMQLTLWGFTARSGEPEGCKPGGLTLLRKLRGRGEEGEEREDGGVWEELELEVERRERRER